MSNRERKGDSIDRKEGDSINGNEGDSINGNERKLQQKGKRDGVMAKEREEAHPKCVMRERGKKKEIW
jgi:hypothetical protein